jgi:hypothetical protein
VAEDEGYVAADELRRAKYYFVADRKQRDVVKYCVNRYISNIVYMPKSDYFAFSGSISSIPIHTYEIIQLPIIATFGRDT